MIQEDSIIENKNNNGKNWSLQNHQVVDFNFITDLNSIQSYYANQAYNRATIQNPFNYCWNYGIFLPSLIIIPIQNNSIINQRNQEN